MSRGASQKFKVTDVMRIMLAKTDDEHALTMPQIMEELEKYVEGRKPETEACIPYTNHVGED